MIQYSHVQEAATHVADVILGALSDLRSSQSWAHGACAQLNHCRHALDAIHLRLHLRRKKRSHTPVNLHLRHTVPHLKPECRLGAVVKKQVKLVLQLERSLALLAARAQVFASQL